MKQAVILHGTNGKPDSNWFPWLKAKLESAGYEVWAPQLPDAHAPNQQTWGDFILNNGFDLTDGIVIGHSAGAVEVLNLLMDERMPHIKLGILVSAWAGGNPKGDWAPDTFKHLFPPKGFDFSLIESKADKLEFIHSRDDQYCPPEQARYLATQLDAAITVRETGGHLSLPELPELWQIIEPNL